MPGFACVIFDFANTLCPDPYFLPLGPAAIATIQRVLFNPNNEIANRWMRGEWSSWQVSRWLAPQLRLPAEQIDAALREGCAHLTFNPDLWALATRLRRQNIKTALVTINADVFTQVVVPAHRLTETFDAIINSADHGQTDKRHLWPRAFAALGQQIGYHNTLLIDDSETAVEHYRQAGGSAIHYQPHLNPIKIQTFALPPHPPSSTIARARSSLKTE